MRVGWATPPRSPRAVTRPRTPYSTRGTVALIALSFGLFQGCAQNPGAAPKRGAQTAANARFAWEGDPSEAPWPVVAASWRDVTAGVIWAASNIEFAVTGVSESGPLVREYELVGLGGETGRVRVEASRLVEGALPSDEWITIGVSLGLLGHADEEAAMHQDLQRYAPRHPR